MQGGHLQSPTLETRRRIPANVPPLCPLRATELLSDNIHNTAKNKEGRQDRAERETATL